jgi:methyltransferase (TIGR00027 family)
MESLIQNISETALWVAVFRADESERPDAIFHDPFARRLASKRGEEIAKTIEFSSKNSWSFVARTYLFDEFITRHVEDGFDMMVNLAAGLDTRPYRMKLPKTLKWVEVDLPEITSYKESILAKEKPACQLERVKLDLADRKKRIELFARLGNEASKILVISEGLIIYLRAEEVAALANDLSDQQNFRRWVLDMQSPGLLAMSIKEMGGYFKANTPVFKFAPAEGEGFFLPHGWKNLESRSKLKTAATLNRLNEEMMNYAAFPEPEGPKGDFPWSGVCLFENVKQK